MEEAQPPGSRCSSHPSSPNPPIFSRGDLRIRRGKQQYYIKDNEYCRFAVPDQHGYANCLAGDSDVGLCHPYNPMLCGCRAARKDDP